MRRVLGFLGLSALALGLAVGTAGTVVGQQGQTGYDDAEVAGVTQLPDDADVFDVEAGGDETFDEDVPPGSFLNVSADGFGSEAKGTIEITSERQTLAFVSADEEGVIRHTVQIPEDIETGEHTLHVIAPGPDGELRDVTIGLTIAFPGEGGSDWPAWTAGSIAAAVALIGAYYYFFIVRKRETDVEAMETTHA